MLERLFCERGGFLPALEEGPALGRLEGKSVDLYGVADFLEDVLSVLLEGGVVVVFAVFVLLDVFYRRVQVAVDLLVLLVLDLLHQLYLVLDLAIGEQVLHVALGLFDVLLVLLTLEFFE